MLLLLALLGSWGTVALCVGVLFLHVRGVIDLRAMRWDRSGLLTALGDLRSAVRSWDFHRELHPDDERRGGRGGSGGGSDPQDMLAELRARMELPPDVHIAPAALLRKRWHIPAEVARQAGAMIDLVMRDFIMSWYHLDLSGAGISNDPRFLEYGQYLITSITGNIFFRAAHLHPLLFIIDDVLEAVRAHVRWYSIMKTRAAALAPHLFEEPSPLQLLDRARARLGAATADARIVAVDGEVGYTKKALSLGLGEGVSLEAMVTKSDGASGSSSGSGSSSSGGLGILNDATSSVVSAVAAVGRTTMAFASNVAAKTVSVTSSLAAAVTPGQQAGSSGTGGSGAAADGDDAASSHRNASMNGLLSPGEQRLVREERRVLAEAQEAAIMRQYQLEPRALHPAVDAAHARLLGAFDTEAGYLRQARPNSLGTPPEIAVEYQYLRRVAAQILDKTLPPPDKAGIATQLLLGEILTNFVLQPTIANIDPDFINTLLLDLLAPKQPGAGKGGSGAAAGGGEAAAAGSAPANTGEVAAAAATPATSSGAASSGAATSASSGSAVVAGTGASQLPKEAGEPAAAAPAATTPAAVPDAREPVASNSSAFSASGGARPRPSSVSSVSSAGHSELGVAAAAAVEPARQAPPPSPPADFDAGSSSGGSDGIGPSAAPVAARVLSCEIPRVDAGWRYFWGPISRDAAEGALRTCPIGSFLLRSKEGGTLVLSYVRPAETVTRTPEVAHTVISFVGTGFAAFHRGPFPTLSRLLRGLRDVVYYGCVQQSKSSSGAPVSNSSAFSDSSGSGSGAQVGGPAPSLECLFTAASGCGPASATQVAAENATLGAASGSEAPRSSSSMRGGSSSSAEALAAAPTATDSSSVAAKKDKGEFFSRLFGLSSKKGKDSKGGSSSGSGNSGAAASPDSRLASPARGGPAVASASPARAARLEDRLSPPGSPAPASLSSSKPTITLPSPASTLPPPSAPASDATVVPDDRRKSVFLTLSPLLTQAVAMQAARARGELQHQDGQPSLNEESEGEADEGDDGAGGGMGGDPSGAGAEDASDAPERDTRRRGSTLDDLCEMDLGSDEERHFEEAWNDGEDVAGFGGAGAGDVDEEAGPSAAPPAFEDDDLVHLDETDGGAVIGGGGEGDENASLTGGEEDGDGLSSPPSRPTAGGAIPSLRLGGGLADLKSAIGASSAMFGEDAPLGGGSVGGEGGEEGEEPEPTAGGLSSSLFPGGGEEDAGPRPFAGVAAQTAVMAQQARRWKRENARKRVLNAAAGVVEAKPGVAAVGGGGTHGASAGGLASPAGGRGSVGVLFAVDEEEGGSSGAARSSPTSASGAARRPASFRAARKGILSMPRGRSITASLTAEDLEAQVAQLQGGGVPLPLLHSASGAGTARAWTPATAAGVPLPAARLRELLCAAAASPTPGVPDPVLSLHARVQSHKLSGAARDGTSGQAVASFGIQVEVVLRDVTFKDGSLQSAPLPPTSSSSADVEPWRRVTVSWTLYHRYSEFHALYLALKDRPGAQALRAQFPPKRVLSLGLGLASSTGQGFLEGRRAGLDAWLREATKVADVAGTADLRGFLVPKEAAAVPATVAYMKPEVDEPEEEEEEDGNGGGEASGDEGGDGHHDGADAEGGGKASSASPRAGGGRPRRVTFRDSTEDALLMDAAAAGEGSASAGGEGGDAFESSPRRPAVGLKQRILGTRVAATGGEERRPALRRAAAASAGEGASTSAASSAGGNDERHAGAGANGAGARNRRGGLKSSTPAPRFLLPHEMVRAETQVFALLSETFDLQSRGWLRRQMVGAVRTMARLLYNGSVAKRLSATYFEAISAASLADYLRVLREVLWPNNVLFTPAGMRPHAVWWADREASRELFVNAAANPLAPLLGRDASVAGLEKLHDMLQIPVIVRSLSHTITDLALQRLFPTIVVHGLYGAEGGAGDLPPPPQVKPARRPRNSGGRSTLVDDSLDVLKQGAGTLLNVVVKAPSSLLLAAGRKAIDGVATVARLGKDSSAQGRHED